MRNGAETRIQLSQHVKRLYCHFDNPDGTFSLSRDQIIKKENGQTFFMRNGAETRIQLSQHVKRLYCHFDNPDGTFSLSRDQIIKKENGQTFFIRNGAETRIQLPQHAKRRQNKKPITNKLTGNQYCDSYYFNDENKEKPTKVPAGLTVYKHAGKSHVDWNGGRRPVIQANSLAVKNNKKRKSLKYENSEDIAKANNEKIKREAISITDESNSVSKNLKISHNSLNTPMSLSMPIFPSGESSNNHANSSSSPAIAPSTPLNDLENFLNLSNFGILPLPPIAPFILGSSSLNSTSNPVLNNTIKFTTNDVINQNNSCTNQIYRNSASHTFFAPPASEELNEEIPSYNLNGDCSTKPK